MRVLFALMALVALEVALYVEVGPRLGVVAILAELLLSALAGVWVLRNLGQAALAALQTPVRLRRGIAVPIAEASLTAMGAMMLILPGLASDTLGALLLVAPVRRWAATRFLAAAQQSVHVHSAGFAGSDPADGSVILDADYADLTPQTEPSDTRSEKPLSDLRDRP